MVYARFSSNVSADYIEVPSRAILALPSSFNVAELFEIAPTPNNMASVGDLVGVIVVMPTEPYLAYGTVSEEVKSLPAEHNINQPFRNTVGQFDLPCV